MKKKDTKCDECGHHTNFKRNLQFEYIGELDGEKVELAYYKCMGCGKKQNWLFNTDGVIRLMNNRNIEYFDLKRRGKYMPEDEKDNKEKAYRFYKNQVDLANEYINRYFGLNHVRWMHGGSMKFKRRLKYEIYGLNFQS